MAQWRGDSEGAGEGLPMWLCEGPVGSIRQARRGPSAQPGSSGEGSHSEESRVPRKGQNSLSGRYELDAVAGEGEERGRVE